MHCSDFAFRLKQRITILGLAAVILSIYFFSLCPTVYLIDSGELAAISYTLGVAHPTGYPLYTLISYFFAHLPGEPIRNLNLLSVLFSTISAIFCYSLTQTILKDRFISIFVAVLFAFCPTIWRISITNEVYPLSALFCVLIFYFLYQLNNERIFYIIMYLIGLSFTNHIIIFSLVIPVFFYIVFVCRLSFKKILIGFLFAGLGLSLYLYIITRTIGGARLAWGNVHDLERLIWHITGKQYQVWMFSLSMPEIIKNLREGVLFLLHDFLYILTIPVVIGFYQLFKYDRFKFHLLLIIFLFNLFYTINYAIPDIEPYYIPSLVSLILVSVYGLKTISRALRWFVVLPIAAAIVLINYRSCTLNNNTFGLNFGLAHIEQLPENSLLICNYWDIYSPIIYLRQIKEIRKDLIVIDKELLRRSWYIKYLKEEYPDFYNGVAKEIEDYSVELYKFEYNKPYNRYTIQAKYIKMLEGFVEIKQKGAYFSSPFPDQDLNAVKTDYYRIPFGLTYKITRDTIFELFDFSKLNIKKPPIINDVRLSYDIGIVKNMVNNNIHYLNSRKKITEVEQAKKWLSKF